mgnify:CR=1 FL=1
MLYFSKLRIFTILIASLFFLFFTLSNFTKLDDSFFNKKINLGLDLQGGSYLLLEIDNKPVITKELQNKITFLKTFNDVYVPEEHFYITLLNLKNPKDEFVDESREGWSLS